MKHLKVTHILNVSNKIPNFFEESEDEMPIQYLRINIEDRSHVPIDLSFRVAYEFMESCF